MGYCVSSSPPQRNDCTKEIKKNEGSKTFCIQINNNIPQIEHKALKEIKAERKELEKKYGKKKAKEMTEVKLKEIMKRLESEEQDNEIRLRENKKRWI